MRVLIFVTHLLGTGHLSRALTLGRAFSDAGHDAHILSGGMPVSNLSFEGIELHQLPPVKSDGVNFTTLLNEDGVADEDYLASRKQFALDTLSELQPDVLITELYPFGRRVLKAEFLSVLNAARDLATPPLVLCSIRDILAPPSKPKKALEADAVLAAYYDGVLVHSDETVTPLNASWPVSAMTQEKLKYTGFVAPPAPKGHPDDLGEGEVLVTAGGGDVGLPLFKSAIEAAALDPVHTWRILVGGSDKYNNINRLKEFVTSDNVVVEGTRSDFRQLLSHAKAAICMCGYNTAMDVLQMGVASVFVPFDAGGEVEQTLRATSLAKQDGFGLVPAQEAHPERLFEALQEVCANPPSPLNAQQFQGAANTVKIVSKMLEGR